MRKSKRLPSQFKLKEDFTYDPETGDFIKYDGRWGGVSKKGYIQITYEGTTYVVHRLIWMWVYGEEPDKIDHLNGDRQDNRLENLRNVDHLTNCRNTRKSSRNTSGFHGVCWGEKDSKWKAQMGVEGRTIHIGSYDTPQEAADARREFIEEFYPEHFSERHGT